MIEHVRQQLAEKYSNYELVITEFHDYYNIPVSSFDYMDGILAVFVPLFLRPSLQEPMYIYNVRTIPVPYHINTAMVDETENENAYTHIIPDTEMVAMNRDTYINVDQSELKQCIKFSVMYFCEQTFARCCLLGSMQGCFLLVFLSLILSCTECVLVWGNCCERLCIEIFVRVLRSSRVTLIM